VTAPQEFEWAVKVVGEYGSHIIEYPNEEEAREYVRATNAVKMPFRTVLLKRQVMPWTEAR
jgi:hypothetical protein